MVSLYGPDGLFVFFVFFILFFGYKIRGGAFGIDGFLQDLYPRGGGGGKGRTKFLVVYLYLPLSLFPLPLAGHFATLPLLDLDGE